ncbi:MAG: hypothetical protein WAV32_05125 [Halobacteriota archaeon]
MNIDSGQVLWLGVKLKEKQSYGKNASNTEIIPVKLTRSGAQPRVAYKTPKLYHISAIQGHFCIPVWLSLGVNYRYTCGSHFS